jgi:hypothetical protein
MTDAVLWAPFIVLVFFGGHAIADYGLQSTYMAEAKVPREGSPWKIVLASHCLIHMFFVTVISFSILMMLGVDKPVAAFVSSLFGMGEFLSHMLIDKFKGLQRISYHADQCLHLGCKVLYSFLILLYV